jgi:hypothetical protein
MNRTAQALGLLGGAALGAGLMYVMDPDRGPLRRAKLRRQAKLASRWTAAKANAAVHEAAVISKDLLDEARKNPYVASILPARKSFVKRLLTPESRTGQIAVVLLGTAIAATGGTLAARTMGGEPAVH